MSLGELRCEGFRFAGRAQGSWLGLIQACPRNLDAVKYVQTIARDRVGRDG